jgi:16S rRNA (adenine1518-N6/adenine1519-N6)-dimethyltransferase
VAGRSREPVPRDSRVGSLTPGTIRALAARHGIRPRKSLGQHFLIEPSLARRIASLAAIGPGSRVVEVGAGLGSLTVALAGTGAEVLALELDRALLAPLAEVVADLQRVRIAVVDAVSADWEEVLDEPGPWTMVANLPYSVAVPVVLGALEREPRIERFLVMVQREVGERLAARPGRPNFGAVSLRVEYRAEARVLRRVARSVFWPEPKVESVLVSLVRRPPPVDVEEAHLWRVIGVAFGQRRKTMRNALVRLGIEGAAAVALLEGCGVDPSARPEELGLADFARVSGSLAGT